MQDGDKFPVSDGDCYRVVDNIRQRVELHRHDMLTGPPELGTSPILYRNLTIYFTDKAKDNLHNGFAHAVKLQGVLPIGGVETMFDAQNLGLTSVNSSFFWKNVSDAPRGLAGASGLLHWV